MRWKIGDRVHDFSQRGLIMGVVNVTPDSFSDGGASFEREQAIAHALMLADEGADIVDIGGESTRPGAEPVGVDEELQRVLPVIESLRARRSTWISIDSSKSSVAHAALEAGADIINDVSGGRADPGMFSVAADHGCAVIIMHMQGTPQTMQLAPHYHDVVGEVANFFRQQYDRAIRCGIDSMAIAFDPGIGFGKTPQHNVDLLGRVGQLRCHGRPLVVGVSRKSFLGKLVGSGEVADREAPTIGLTALLRGKGADVLRVHRVKENVAALRVADAILQMKV